MLKYIRLALAAWRLASLLVVEDGPGDMFAIIRERAGVRYDTNGKPYGLNAVAQALTCLWCASVWTALAVLVIERVFPPLNDLLAVSAGAIGWQGWHRRG